MSLLELLDKRSHREIPKRRAKTVADLGLVDVRTLTKAIQRSPSWIYHEVAKGIPLVRLGGRLYFDPADVLAWMKSRGRKQRALVK